MTVQRRILRLALPVLLAAVTLRCGPAESGATTTDIPSAVSSSAAPSPNIPAVSSSDFAMQAGGAVQLTVAPTGNEVRYRIREQLVRVPLPNDAIGKTSDVTGGIAVAADGKIITAQSKFVVNVATLTSDRDRRDGFVKSRVLETDQFPTVEFSPTSVRGLPKSLPALGTHTFDLTGNLTVRGVTRPTTWKVTAMADGGRVTGKAATAFTFADFSIKQPRVPIVLSVADTIRLEYDFSLIPKT